MEVAIRQAKADDEAEWSRMRVALWPETSAEDHASEIAAFLTGNLTGWLAGLHAVAAFVAVRPGGELCGFLEASVRPLADGCITNPVGYIEAWYVDPDVRQKGVGRKLVEAAEAWVSSQGCREMASDAHVGNCDSIAAHKALGFTEEAPCVRFRKWLAARAGERKAAHRLTLVSLEGGFAVCRLDADAPLPAWATGGPFLSITRTAVELSVVCPQEVVPESVRSERNWRCLRVAGTFDFSEVGVLASLATPLAKASISIFAISTFDTDYIFVKADDFLRAVEVLQQAGHVVRPNRCNGEG